jgi:hypothetical protein
MSVALVDEVLGADFGDKRLDKRLGKVIEQQFPVTRDTFQFSGETADSMASVA